MADVPGDDQDQDEDVVCLCEWLSRDTIIEAIPFARDLKDLKEQTGVCSTCFGCESDLDDILAEHGHRFGSALAPRTEEGQG